MKEFRAYLAEARQLISEDVQIQEELLSFFEENNIQYNDHLLDFARDLVLQTEGIDLKEKLSKVKDFFKSSFTEIKEKLKELNTPKNRMLLLMFVVYLVFLMMGGDLKSTKNICSTYCNVSPADLDTVFKMLKTSLLENKQNLSDVLKTSFDPEAVSTLTDSMSSLKTVLSKFPEALKNSIKPQHIAGVLSMFGIKDLFKIIKNKKEKEEEKV